MIAPRKPKTTLDIKSLYSALAENLHAAQTHDAQSLREKTLEIIKPAYIHARVSIQQQFEASENAPQVLKDNSRLMDALITVLFQVAGKHVFGKEVEALKKHLSILAVGGYGRGELFPYSDVDILFLFSGREHTSANRLAEFILYVLWDLGLTVGHAVRNMQEAIAQAQLDMTVRTTLLDARRICGEQELFDNFIWKFHTDVRDGSELQFVESKLEERDKRHQRTGDSRYMLEPNIKEGKGGLRDLHTLDWIARYCYPVRKVSELVKLGALTAKEYREYAAAQHFFTVVRVHLHYMAGRAEERLTFDKQRAIAGKLGFRGKDSNRAVERFMKRYFLFARSVGYLTRLFCALLEEEKKRKPRLALGALLSRKQQLGAFVLEGERLTVDDEYVFTEDPVRMLELFSIAQEKELDIHPRALQIISRNLDLAGRTLHKNRRANEVFLSILLSPCNPEITLRRMNEAGVLGRFLPDFGRVIGQMQFDMYHTYTVDEHTIVALGNLHKIEKGEFAQESPVATKVVHQIASRAVLYLALLCHDIAKGRGGDHSELGEKIVRKLAARLGLTEREQESTAWLVRNHLLMSHTATKRDIADPETIRRFVEEVQTIERLRMLLVLTVADIRAVGPTVWNGWKGALLRDLYYRAEESMGASDMPAVEQQVQQLRAALRDLLIGWNEEEIESYMNNAPPGFLTSCPAAVHARIARLAHEVTGQLATVVLDMRVDEFHSVSEIIVCAHDQPGLFSKVCGVMSLSGANIVGCKIFTLKNGIAVEVFDVQDVQGKPFGKPEKLKRLQTQIERVLEGTLDLDKEIVRQPPSYPSRVAALKIPPAVYVDNSVSGSYTVIEISGQDRLGFLYRITKAIASQGLSIATAHISTYGARAVDVFYVKDLFGMKIEHEIKIKQVREAILETLANGKESVKLAG